MGMPIKSKGHTTEHDLGCLWCVVIFLVLVAVGAVIYSIMGVM